MPTREGMWEKDKEKLCGIRREIVIFCLLSYTITLFFVGSVSKCYRQRATLFLGSLEEEILSRRRRGTEEEAAAEETGS